MTWSWSRQHLNLPQYGISCSN